MTTTLRTPYSRVWIIQHRAGPSHQPVFQATAKAGAPEHSLGDVTPVYEPSKDQFGKFEEVGVTRGAEDRPTMQLMFRYKDARSAIEKMAKAGCPFDIQVHFGACKEPTNYAKGWNKIIAFENAYPTNYALGDLGAFEQSEDAAIDETVDVSGQWFYEIIPMAYAQRAQTEVAQEITAIVVGDNISCGECDRPSDGCQAVFAVSAPSPSSPGVKAEVIFSDDSFVTAGDTWVSTLNIGEDASDAVPMGDNLIIISNDSNSIHWADMEDILNGMETWAEVSTGFVALKVPNCITKASAADAWIGADDGYIYYTADPTQGVEVQDAGNATTEDINDIHAYNTQVVIAGADAGIVLYTLDGQAWAQTVTSPDPVNLPNIMMVCAKDEKTWFAGTNDGALWYTTNQGVTWTQKRIPGGDDEGGGGTLVFDDMKFATNMVGYLAVHTAVPAGKLLRTIDGGYSWYLVPEGAGSIPANDYINSLDVCAKEANVVFAGGLADSAADGIIIKGS